MLNGMLRNACKVGFSASSHRPIGDLALAWVYEKFVGTGEQLHSLKHGERHGIYQMGPRTSMLSRTEQHRLLAVLSIASNR